MIYNRRYLFVHLSVLLVILPKNIETEHEFSGKVGTGPLNTVWIQGLSSGFVTIGRY